MEQALFYLVFSPFALILELICIIFTIVNRRKDAFGSLVWFMSLIAGAIFLTDMELLAGTAKLIFTWSHISYCIIPFIPLAWFLFCFEYSSQTKQKVSARYIVFLSLIPLVTIVIAWTNSLHHLLWITYGVIKDGRFAINKVTAYGPWFLVHTLYSYLLYIAGIALIFRDFFTRERIRQHQSVYAIVGAGIPVAVNFLYVFRLIPGITRDYSSLIFALSSFFFLMSLVSHRLDEVTEQHNNTLLSKIEQPLILLDQNGLIQNENELAIRLLGRKPGRNIPITDVIRIPFEEMRQTANREGFAGEKIALDENQNVFAHMYATGQDREGHTVYTMVLKDIDTKNSISQISRRERDVYDLLVKDMTMKEIAEALCISENTVKTHTKHIYDKLHVTNKRQLIETSRPW